MNLNGGYTAAATNGITSTSDWFNPWPTSNPRPTTFTWPTYTYSQPRCAWCQGTHTTKCPDLKSVTYRPDGTIERVEFFDHS